MREVHHFIGGKSVTGTSGRFGDIYNPNTGEVQARVALATEFPRQVEVQRQNCIHHSERILLMSYVHLCL